MAQILFTAPLPPAGGQWCTLCAMIYKGSALEKLAEAIKLAESMPGQYYHLELNGTTELAEGVALALVQLPVPGAPPGATAQVLTWACWSHLGGLKVSDSQIIQAAAGDLPAGIPLLGKRGG
jgi:hypothetical protein